MSQHDMDIANGSGATVRADVTAALKALASTSAGSSAPSTVYTGQFWVDTNTPSATVWTVSQYDGADWAPIYYIDTVNNTIAPILTNEVTVTSMDAGAGAGPDFFAFRDSATPAASDFIGTFNLDGRSSTGVRRTFGRLIGQITDPTNASEDADIFFQNIVGGTLATQLQLISTGVSIPGTLALGGVAASGALAASTYTPTLTNIANASASTPNVTFYARIGNLGVVAGALDVTPTTAAGTQTRVGISLPVASNFASAAQAAGVASANAIAEAGAILSDSTNDRAELSFAAQTTSSHTLWFIFAYRIV